MMHSEPTSVKDCVLPQKNPPAKSHVHTDRSSFPKRDRAEIKNLQESILLLSTSNRNYTKNIKKLENELEDIVISMKHLQAENSELKQTLAAQLKSPNLSHIDKDLSKSLVTLKDTSTQEDNYDDLYKKNKEAITKMTSYELLIQDLRNEVTQLASDSSHRSAQITSKVSELQAISSRIPQLDHQLTRLSTDNSDLTQQSSVLKFLLSEFSSSFSKRFSSLSSEVSFKLSALTQNLPSPTLHRIQKLLTVESGSEVLPHFSSLLIRNSETRIPRPSCKTNK